MGQARHRGTFEQRRELAMAKRIKQARLVILTAMDPQTDPAGWEPVLPDDVPPAVREGGVIAELVKGRICQEFDGGPWYRAERVGEAA